MAQAAAQVIDDHAARAAALTALVPLVPTSQQEPLLQAARAATQGVVDLAAHASACAALAPHLLGPTRQQALREGLRAAKAVDNETARLDALAELLPLLDEAGQREAMSEVFTATLAIESKQYGTEWFEDEDFLFDAESRAALLGRLAPSLPAGTLCETLALVRTLRDERYRSKALVALAPHFPEALWQDASQAAQSIQDARERTAVFAAYAPGLLALDARVLHPLWNVTLRRSGQRTRYDLLSDIRAFSAVISYLGGPRAAGEVFDAIQDVGRWWP
jgi:hypothetical protein